MIKKTIQKALEYSKALTEIIKAWSEAIVSLMAAITAVFTGVREIRKFSHHDTMVSMEAPSKVGGNELKSSQETQVPSSAPVGGYYFDANTAIFLGTSLVFVFILARRKFKKSQSNTGA
jgi:hypothetical protein